MRFSRWHLTIRDRLRLITVLTSAAALLTACTALFVYELTSFRGTITKDLGSLAEVVAANATQHVLFSQRSEAEEILAALGAKPHVLAAALYQTDSGLFVGWSPAGITADFPAHPGPDGLRSLGDDLVLCQPLAQREQRLGTLYLRYDYASKLHELERIYAGIVVLVLVASLGLAFFLSAWLQRMISEPIIALVSTARLITERQDFSVRAQKLGENELSPLIDSFNQMLGRIQEQDAALRRVNDELEDRVRIRTREFQQLQRELGLILNSAGEGIYGLNLEGRITFVNPAAAKALGWEVTELIGQPDHEIMRHVQGDGRFLSAELCPVCQAHRDGRLHRMPELSFAKKNGTRFPVESVSTPILAEARVAGVVVVFRDITERRSLESQLRQAVKMESIGRMAAGVAHDFNNLLMVIHGQATMLSESLSKDPEGARALAEVLRAAERAGNLTNQLLIFSRKRPLQRTAVDVSAVVANVSRMLSRLLGERMKLELELGEGLPKVLADASSLEQVLMNLAVNARDAMSRGGKLTIATGTRTVDETLTRRNPEARLGLFVTLRLTDTGAGMSAETLSRLFEPFFTTKAAGQGTGLGLSTVYGIVKHHQGWLEVESVLGQGSTFTVYLPPCDPRTDVASPPATEPSLLGGATKGEGAVLLVEDEPEVRKMTARFLEQAGYRVFQAGSAVEALTSFERTAASFDLLVTDVVLPEAMDGVELSRRLTAANPKLRVLYVSGYPAEATGHENTLVPGVNFLPKPFTRESLAAAAKRRLSPP